MTQRFDPVAKILTSPYQALRFFCLSAEAVTGDLITQNAFNAAIMICYKSIETTNVMFSPSERTALP